MRIDQATSALMDLVPQYFPKAIREKAERVLSVREKLQHHNDSNVGSFPFDLLKPKECAALIRDILSLYEACIFDMSEEIKRIVHLDEQ